MYDSLTPREPTRYHRVDQIAWKPDGLNLCNMIIKCDVDEA